MRRFKASLLGIFWMLVIQFLLGMAVDDFTTLTRHHPGANPSEFFSGAVQSVLWALTSSPIVLILHTILGLLLVLSSIFILVRAFQLGSAGTRILAALGFIGIVGAGFNGASFLSFGQDINSYLMSVGFALAAVVYTQLLYTLSAVV